MNCGSMERHNDMATNIRPQVQTDVQDVLRISAERAQTYVQTIGERRGAPAEQDVAALSRFRETFPDKSTAAHEVVAMLDEIGSAATVATTGRRYFGFVVGGALPAVMAANWLAGAWDQPAGLRVMSPL